MVAGEHRSSEPPRALDGWRQTSTSRLEKVVGSLASSIRHSSCSGRPSSHSSVASSVVARPKTTPRRPHGGGWAPLSRASSYAP